MDIVLILIYAFFTFTTLNPKKHPMSVTLFVNQWNSQLLYVCSNEHVNSALTNEAVFSWLQNCDVHQLQKSDWLKSIYQCLRLLVAKMMDYIMGWYFFNKIFFPGYFSFQCYKISLILNRSSSQVEKLTNHDEHDYNYSR